VTEGLQPASPIGSAAAIRAAARSIAPAGPIVQMARILRPHSILTPGLALLGILVGRASETSVRDRALAEALNPLQMLAGRAEPTRRGAAEGPVGQNRSHWPVGRESRTGRHPGAPRAAAATGTTANGTAVGRALLGAS